MNFWKKLPYWLRGGVIGGGIAIFFYISSDSCFWLAISNLPPGEIGFTYKCLFFSLANPAYWVTAWLMLILDPILKYGDGFIEAYALIISIPVSFLIGSTIGVLWGFLKRNKKEPAKASSYE